jgi:cysteine desulfurase
VSDSHIYLDHNATTPPHPDVLAAMQSAHEAAWANPSSVHRPGQRARAELDRARAAVAELVGLHPRDVLLTSGGTEANNIAISSLCGPDGGLLTTAIEHPSVLRTADRLARAGIPVAIAEPNASGQISVAAITRAAETIPAIALLSMQMVNHETGIIQPLDEVIAWAHARDVLVHVDAVQAVAKVTPDSWQGADLITVAAHKIRGPKGIGALVTRPRIKLAAQMGGGEQERGLRPGTQSAALAAGFRVAAERAKEGPARYEELAVLRDERETQLLAMAKHANSEVFINGEGARAPHVTNQSWMGWRGPELCAALDLEGVAISSGAACSAGTAEPSAVIRAMLGEARAVAAIRMSLGETTTHDDIDAVCAAFERVMRRNAERLSS